MRYCSTKINLNGTLRFTVKSLRSSGSDGTCCRLLKCTDSWVIGPTDPVLSPVPGGTERKTVETFSSRRSWYSLLLSVSRVSNDTTIKGFDETKRVRESYLCLKTKRSRRK